MNHVNIGVVGLGAIAETHLNHLQEIPGVTIVAVADVNLRKAESIAQAYDIPSYFQGADDMFRNVHLDGVFICTPNRTHIPIAKAAAEKGIHTLLEKPIGTDLQEVSEYIKLADQKGILTMVGMTHRFRNDVRLLKDHIESGALGEIYYAKAKLFRRRGTPEGWFTNRSLAGGGVMMDIGVHVLDLVWWMLGSPGWKTLSGHTLPSLGKYQTHYTRSWESKNKDLNADQLFDVEDFGSAWIRFTNGTVLSLEVAWAMNGDEDEGIHIELLGTKGGATMTPLTFYKEENKIMSKSSPYFEMNRPFQDEIQHFIDCIKTKSRPLIDRNDGYQVLQMLHGIYESSRKQKEIRYEN